MAEIYFRPALSYHLFLNLIPLLYLFWSGHLRQVSLYQQNNILDSPRANDVIGCGSLDFQISKSLRIQTVQILILDTTIKSVSSDSESRLFANVQLWDDWQKYIHNSLCLLYV